MVGKIVSAGLMIGMAWGAAAAAAQPVESMPAKFAPASSVVRHYSSESCDWNKGCKQRQRVACPVTGEVQEADTCYGNQGICGWEHSHAD